MEWKINNENFHSQMKQLLAFIYPYGKPFMPLLRIIYVLEELDLNSKVIFQQKYTMANFLPQRYIFKKWQKRQRFGFYVCKGVLVLLKFGQFSAELKETGMEAP